MGNREGWKDVGIAVVGGGYWGANLVRNFSQLGALRVICDNNEIVLTRFAELYPDVERCVALSDAWLRDDVNGVVVATPAETHFAVAREALLSDKHVFVEKPMALATPEAEELIELAKSRKRILMVGHLLQYHPAFVRLKELVRSGELGRINYIYSSRLNLGKIRREENILWSFAPHDISMILALTGELPSRVFSTGGNYLHERIADVTVTCLEFPSGIGSHIFVSWLHPFKEQKLVVVGQRKMAVFDDTEPWGSKLLLYPHEIKWKNSIPVAAKAGPERVEIEEEEPLRTECEHFLGCVANGNRPLTDGEEGLRVLKVLNASQELLDGKRRNVIAGGFQELCRPRVMSCRPHGDAGYYVHETAVVDADVDIGASTKIWHFSHILTGSRIGEECNIGQNVMIGPDVSIGRKCKIQNNVAVYKGVTLEDEVFCGPSMVFTNVYNPRAHISKMGELRQTRVKRGATLGANCTIICGVTIGKYAFIGAGAVVTRSVSDHALALGNPAREVGWVCSCGERLENDLKCVACGRQYEKCDTGVREKRI